MTQAPPREHLSNTELARSMGLVVAHRFLLWGSAVGALTGFFLIQGAHFPQLLRHLSFPMILAIYLLGTGYFLYILRLSDWTGRLLAVIPAGSVVLLGVPAVASRAQAVAMVLGGSLILYLWSVIRQARALGHIRTVGWLSRTGKAATAACVLALVTPGLASQIVVFCGLALALATTLGWQVWLAELRQSIAEREAV